MKGNCFKSCFCSKVGFTLIELLVVVLIIGILTAVAVPQYQKAVDKARVSELFAIVKNVKVQQEVFYLTHGHYAADCEELGADLPGGFEQKENNANVYMQTKGSFEISLFCKNKDSSDTDYNRVAGKVRSADNSFQASIEMFFDYYSNENVRQENKGHQGDAFCFASNSNTRGLNVCKSLGREVRTEDFSYWL